MPLPSNENEWLDEVGTLCMSTLEEIQTKAMEGKDIDDADIILREICLGYLYLLTLSNNEGLMPESFNFNNNITIH